MTETYTKPLILQQEQYRGIAKQIQEIINLSVSGNTFFNLSDNASLLKIVPNDVTRVFAENFSGLTAFRNLILSSLLYLGKVSPICGLLYLDILKNQLLLKQLPQLPPRGFRVSSQDFFDAWSGWPITGLTKRHDMEIISAIQEAGCRGTLRITCGTSDKKEISDGCIFELSTPDGFFSNKNEVLLTDSKILIYEGAINEISKIHHILEQCTGNAKNLIIFASSFSKDVAYTLAKNIELNKLRVFPIQIIDDIENVNDIHDLSFLTCSIPITRDNGGSLSSVNIHELQSVRSINLNFLTMKMKFDINYNVVSRLRKILSEKIASEQVRDKEDIFRKRMSRLMNHNVHISLKTNKFLEGIIQDRVGFFINTMTSIARENAVYSSEVLSDENSQILPRYIPYFSTKQAIKRASSDSSFILNTRMAIIVDNE